MRVVSLLPAATEIVALLGQTDSLVGLSHECDWPPRLPDDLPRLTEPRVDPEGASGEIDGEVRDLLADGLSIYDLDVETLVGLEPDVVLTQDQCSVCAVDLEQVEEALADRVGEQVELVSLQPSTIEQITQVAEALEVEAEGLVRRRKMARKMDRATNAVPPNTAAPTVCFIEWLDPLMVAGHWIPEMVDRAGGRYPFAEAGEPSRQVDFAEIREADPDVIIIAPCGMDTIQLRSELGSLTERDGWNDLSAVERARVHPVDGHHYFNRPGPRLLDSLGILVRLVWPGEEHPDETADQIFGNPEAEG
jgi:iron complex transport system substrate-binding protein